MLKNNGLLGTSITLFQLDLAFYFLKEKEVQMFVKKQNKRALNFNRKIGFNITKSDSKFIYFMMEKDEYEKNKPQFNRFYKKANFIEKINH